MATQNSTYIYIDGINRTTNAVLPIKTGDFLDERLDECNLSLRGVKKEIFSPLTPVDIIIVNDFYYGEDEDRKAVKKTETIKYYIVANDNATEMQVGSGIYNHELSLIEVTKVAECVVVDSLTYTNDIGRNYTDNAQIAEPRWE